MSLSYKSFCCTLGTTSFRTQELNRKIERQLMCLEEFWAIPKYAKEYWSDNEPVQQAFYELLKEKEFLTGDAKRPAKDAREKTSGLVEIGLIDDERRITLAGKKILEIAKAGDFTPDGNLLDISRDSYQYFLQLLKASKSVNDHHVRPFVVFLRLLSGIKAKERYLTQAEFTYLSLMCIDEPSTKLILEKINEARSYGKEVDVDEVIVSILMAMDNYHDAHSVFMGASKVDAELIMQIGMNRKSGSDGAKQFDVCYLNVFNALHNLTFDSVSEHGARQLLVAIEGVSGNCQALWRKAFFPVPAGKRLPKCLLPVLNRNMPIFSSKNDGQFRSTFFKMLHLFKAKATLKDYADLNRRYFSLSDCAIFQDGKVMLDALPAAMAVRMKGWLEKNAFCVDPSLAQPVRLDQLLGTSTPTVENLVTEALGKSIVEVRAAGGAHALMKQERYSKLATLLDKKFTRDNIIKLLALIEDRKNDAIVRQQVTDAADVPTIFEYIVALAWYYVSGKKGDVLAYMNLSLGPDLLPKVHAGGGEADIMWHYDKNSPHYDNHTLMIEVTLAEKDAQRRMEMEPVSRHLGDYLIEHPAANAYCTFVTTNLNFNVISDYKSRRTTEYYCADGSKSIPGMKIIPIDTTMLRRMLEKGTAYSTIYEEFEDYHNKAGAPLPLHSKLRTIIET